MFWVLLCVLLLVCMIPMIVVLVRVWLEDRGYARQVVVARSTTPRKSNWLHLMECINQPVIPRWMKDRATVLKIEAQISAESEEDYCANCDEEECYSKCPLGR